MIRVGVYGATGYMGGEVLRVLLEHPHVELAWATSRGDVDIAESHRNFYGLDLNLIRPDDVTDCDIVFVALPSGHAMNMAPEWLAKDARLIDLGSDFRLPDIASWERVYGKQHSAPELVADAAYGIPELHRERVREARVIANPGCFSSAAIFALAPLVREGLVESERLVVDGLSGTAGAGAELDVTMHHPEIGNNLVAYNVVDHRHSYEMETQLAMLTKEKVTVHFTPAYAPITRGILAICHAFPKQPVKRDDLLSVYRDFYAGEEFIKIFDMPKEQQASWQYKPYPWVSAVSGTNYCHIGLDVDEQRSRIVVFSVLDSMGKGGSHAGVQNMNLLFGLDEREGLRRRGMHPY